MAHISKRSLYRIITQSKNALVFDILLEIIEKYNLISLHAELIVLKARYARLKEQVRHNTVHWEDRNVEESRITQSLKEIVDALPDTVYEIEVKQEKREGRPIWKYWAIIPIGLLVFWVVKTLTCHDVNQMSIPPPPAATLQSVPRPDTFKVQAPPTLFTALKSKKMSKESHLVIGKDTFPLAYIDFSYQKGREQEANMLQDACWYEFDVKNPSKENIVIENLFVELYRYRPLPTTTKIIAVQPFEEATVVYLLMDKNAAKGSNIYKNLFYIVNDKRKNWGRIKVLPNQLEQIAARVNAKYPGLYTFQLGFQYKSDLGDSLARKYILPHKVTWAFQQD